MTSFFQSGERLYVYLGNLSKEEQLSQHRDHLLGIEILHFRFPQESSSPCFTEKSDFHLVKTYYILLARKLGFNLNL